MYKNRSIIHSWGFWLFIFFIVMVGLVALSVATGKRTHLKPPGHVQAIVPVIALNRAPGALPSTTCAIRGSSCAKAEIQVMNQIRASVGVVPLKIDWTQTNPATHGNPGCLGSVGHSKSMVATGNIWHVYPGDSLTQPTNPASFPNDVCARSFSIAENVAASGNGATKWDQILDGLNNMMQEQHDPLFCAQYSNHACTIINPVYTRVGIGYAHGTIIGYSMWVQTQDFLS